jgi:cysteine synthase
MPYQIYQNHGGQFPPFVDGFPTTGHYVGWGRDVQKNVKNIRVIGQEG